MPTIKQFYSALPGTVIGASKLIAPGGDIGPAGAKGQDGTIGADGKPSYTTTAQSFTVPSIGSTVSIVVADASWMAIGEMVYINSAGAGGGAGVLQVIAKAANTITLLNPAPPTGLGAMELSSLIWGEIPTGNTNGTNRTFTSSYPYNPNFFAVFLNGLRQRLLSDYNQTGAQSFQFLNAPGPGDTVSIDYAQQ
jgi:hypothetical protein